MGFNTKSRKHIESHALYVSTRGNRLVRLAKGSLRMSCLKLDQDFYQETLLLIEKLRHPFACHTAIDREASAPICVPGTHARTASCGPHELPNIRSFLALNCTP